MSPNTFSPTLQVSPQPQARAGWNTQELHLRAVDYTTVTHAQRQTLRQWN